MELQINTCFKNIQDFILSDIQNAQEQILIAVAWFTNKNNI